MRQTEFLTAPFVRSVVHAVDHSDAGRPVFAHALAIALFRGTRFTILRAGAAGGCDWRDQPSVRDLLARWDLLGRHRAALDDLLRRTDAVATPEGDPLAAALKRTARRAADLIVLPTGDGAVPSGADVERAARRSRAMALFVPPAGRGFVSLADGALSLRRILVPIDRRPAPQPALRHAARAAQMTGADPVEIILLHVSAEPGPGFDLTAPAAHSCTWTPLHRAGDPADVILEAAEELAVDLVVMPTAGRHGLLDALRGSVAGSILRLVRCPVVVVPAR